MGTEKGKELAEAHWGYVETLLNLHNVGANIVNLVDVIGFHYKSSFEHGYKHAKEEYEKERKHKTN